MKLYYIALILAAVIVVMLYRRYRDLPRPLKFLAHLMLCHVVFQGIAVALLKVGINNFIFYKVVLLVYYYLTYEMLGSLFYSVSLKKTFNVIFTLGLVVILVQYSTTFLTTDGEGLTNSVLVQNLVFAFACLLVYYQMLKQVSLIPLSAQWNFLLVTAIFIYSMVSLAYWMMSKISYIYDVGQSGLDYLNDAVYLIEIMAFMWAAHTFLRKKPISEN